MSSLYQNLMGKEFSQLAPLLQGFHIDTNKKWEGEAQISWNKNPLVRALLWLGRLPKEAMCEQITVRIIPRENNECWQRHFGSRTMRSKQYLYRRVLHEKFGPFCLILNSHSKQGDLHQSCSRSYFLGLPLPPKFTFKITAREWQENERFNFDVKIGLAKLTLIHYQGWLLPSGLRT